MISLYSNCLLLIHLSLLPLSNLGLNRSKEELIMNFFEETFWLSGPNYISIQALWIATFLRGLGRPIKIDNFDVSFSVDKNVGRTKVSVNETIHMKNVDNTLEVSNDSLSSGKYTT